MIKVAIVFPGQGTQVVGMGKDVYDSSPNAKGIFNKAEKLIPGIREIIFNGPQEKLTETRYCQPAIVTASVALLETFKAHYKFQNIDTRFVCGLSLGEYSAVAASGALSFDDTIKLLEKRGAYMEEASKLRKGSMAAVIGFDMGQLVSICNDVGAEIANFNSPDQTVITGDIDKVALASDKIKATGAKRVIPLEVSGGFHSSLMQPAADKLKETLAKMTFNNAKIPIVSNVDGKPTIEAQKIVNNLEAQITSSVRWIDSIEYIKSQGINTFIEIGPGNVLKGLIRKIDKELIVHNISTNADIESIEF